MKDETRKEPVPFEETDRGKKGIPIYRGRSRRRKPEDRPGQAGDGRKPETEPEKNVFAEIAAAVEAAEAKEKAEEKALEAEAAESAAEEKIEEKIPEPEASENAESEAPESEESEEMDESKPEAAESTEPESAESEEMELMDETEPEPAEPKPLKPVLMKGLAAALALAVIGGGGWYLYEAGKYDTVFFPNTVINGHNVSKMSLEEAGAELNKDIADYSLTLLERGDVTEEITGKELRLYFDYEDGLRGLLMAQKPMTWISHWDAVSVHNLERTLVYDEDLFADRIASLSALDSSTWQEPESAKISEYNPEIKGYEVVPHWPGTEIIAENVTLAVAEAVESLAETVDLDAAGCYMNAAITDVDDSLVNAVNELNTYTGTVINYTFGDDTEVLDGDRIHEWLLVDGTTVTLDEELAAAYVKELAEKHNTSGKEKKLMTSYGAEVSITRGNYGWKIDEKKELETLLAAVRAGETQTREPEFSQRAVSWGEKDYGDTYVEINLTTQHLFFYKDGELVIESDFVSGNEARRMSTPDGAYFLFNKMRNATLVGEDYRTPVSYWMPFNGGIGLHDATWRGSFGGTIYKRNGSHGCVNLPLKTASTIYENITIGDPVLCYHLDPSTIKKEEVPEETKPAETKAEETKPAETKPAETKPAATKPAVKPTPAPTAAPTEAPTTPIPPTETLPAATEEAPDKPSIPAGPQGNPNVPQTESTQAPPSEGLPADPTEPPAPPVTAGGDKESFGPGFTEAPAPVEATQPFGPGM